nr:U1_MYRTX_Ta1a [Tetramorium africanum]
MKLSFLLLAFAIIFVMATIYAPQVEAKASADADADADAIAAASAGLKEIWEKIKQKLGMK